jgi:hypothetical protein
MSDEQVQEHKEKEPGDWLLRAWIAGIHTGGVGFSVVLTTAAGVISGQLISEAKYFESLSVVLSEGFPQRKEEFRTVFDDIKRLDKPMPIRQVHLRDAQLFTLQGAIPLGAGGLWRGDLSSIIGHAIGQVSLTPIA